MPERAERAGPERPSERTADDIGWLDATAQAELVRTGQITPTELLEAAIVRIEKLNPELNAVIHTMFDKARAAAAARALPDGPFRGVPFLIKDAVAHTAGDPFHAGMRVLRDVQWVETNDTWLASRFREAGFVICGKTNLPELASINTTEPLAYGATHNPWSTTHSPGGSSGGAAAAVASGMVPVAHGNDMGGSIRFPAGACGLVGLKPTRARSTLGPDFGEYWGPLTHEHVLTRTVRDSAGVLDAIAGPGVGDPYTAPPPLGPWRDEVGAPPGRLRIGVRTQQRDGAGESHADCVAAVDGTARLLESLGHDVSVVDAVPLDDPELTQAMVFTFTAVIAHEVDRIATRIGRPIELDELEPFNALLTEMGRGVTAHQWLTGIDGIQHWARGVASLWAGDDALDILITPTSPEPPFLLGELSPASGEPFTVLTRVASLTGFMLPFNITGQPAVSLPMHWNDAGLPIGVQLVAAYGREDMLIRVASQLEEAQPWAHRRPPVSA
jgi:amidase